MFPMLTGRYFRPMLPRNCGGQRDCHNARLRQFCEQHGISLADICSRLNDEHCADELHPNAEGAKIIAEEVFKELALLHKEVSR